MLIFPYYISGGSLERYRLTAIYKKSYFNKIIRRLLRLKQFLRLSLIEFLLAFIIIIALTVAAIPIITNFYQKYRVTTQIQNLNHVLQYARNEAIKTHQTIYVNFQTGDNWCYGVNAGSACTCSTVNSCSLGSYSATKPHELTLAASALIKNSLTFEGKHGATNTPTTITFTLFGNTPSIGIKVTSLGNMQYCSSNYSGYIACY